MNHFREHVKKHSLSKLLAANKPAWMPAKLPAPLQIMTAKESGPWLTDVIIHDYNNGLPYGSKQRRTVSWGDARLKPAWWPDHLWRWEQTLQYSKLRRDEYSGVGRATECYKKIIAHYLETQFGLNADDYVSEDFVPSYRKMCRLKRAHEQKQ